MTNRSGRPKKRLGQHFLTHAAIIQDILHACRFNPDDTVLEIGPGKGALTIPLASMVSHLYAVEKDSDLIQVLDLKIARAGLSNITLIHDDILRFDLAEIAPVPSPKIGVIGNLPYNISSPCLEKLMRHRSAITHAILMFQREVASRLSASPGEKAYGAMTVLVRYYAKIVPLIKVPRNAFFPRPKVDSTVLEIDFESPYPRSAENEAVFVKVVKGAFSHRRKTLMNSLKRFFPFLNDDELQRCLEGCGIDPRRRAETLHMDEFLCLADKLPLTNEV